MNNVLHTLCILFFFFSSRHLLCLYSVISEYNIIQLSQIITWTFSITETLFPLYLNKSSFIWIQYFFAPEFTFGRHYFWKIISQIDYFFMKGALCLIYTLNIHFYWYSFYYDIFRRFKFYTIRIGYTFKIIHR